MEIVVLIILLLVVLLGFGAYIVAIYRRIRNPKEYSEPEPEPEPPFVGGPVEYESYEKFREALGDWAKVGA
jgi:hypothetical protein